MAHVFKSFFLHIAYTYELKLKGMNITCVGNQITKYIVFSGIRQGSVVKDGSYKKFIETLIAIPMTHFYTSFQRLLTSTSGRRSENALKWLM